MVKQFGKARNYNLSDRSQPKFLLHFYLLRQMRGAELTPVAPIPSLNGFVRSAPGYFPANQSLGLPGAEPTQSR
ncbi:MAG: hypothetical protein LBH42_03235, partial [Treponema sp.]|nr:hypothetical protein [Treponema sp.]